MDAIRNKHSNKEPEVKPDSPIPELPVTEETKTAPIVEAAAA